MKVLSASLKVDLKSSPRTIRALAQALTPETLAGNKCQMKISRSSNENKLLLAFNSRDLVSLRASFNTNLRLVSASIKTIETVSNFSGHVDRKTEKSD